MSKAAYQKQWRLDNLDYLKEYNRQYRLEHPKKYLLRKAANNAQQFNREFCITEEDITIPEVCPVLGIPIFLEQQGKAHENSPSLDRFDSSRGYTKDNINVISWKANRLKNNGTLEDFEKIVEWMKNA